jgi:hypothetical protein
MRYTFAAVAVLACSVGPFACGLGTSEPGSFEIVFDWLDPEPDNDAGLWVWARVERREGGAQPVQMAEAALTAFSPGVQLPLSDVPYSGNLVVVVEIKEANSKNARARYFGESDTFALEPGKHVKVTVKLKLTKTPDAPEGALLIVEATEKGYVKSALVTLSVQASRATKIIAANDMGFSAGVAEKSLSDLGKDGARYLWSGWDLNSGLCTTQNRLEAGGLRLEGNSARGGQESPSVDRAHEGRGKTPINPESNGEPRFSAPSPSRLRSDPNPRLDPSRAREQADPAASDLQPTAYSLQSGSSACVDGLRTAYVKFSNDNGYESAALSAQVTLDTTAPTLAGGSVTPEFANEVSRVTVVVNPVEPLSADPVLHVSPSDPGFSAAKKEGESYVFTYDVNDAAVEGTAYSFTVDLVDLAGNETKGALIDGTVTVDRTPPVVSGVGVDKARVGVGGTVTVMFSVEEELSEEPVVTIGDKTMSRQAGGLRLEAGGTTATGYGLRASGPTPTGWGSIAGGETTGLGSKKVLSPEGATHPDIKFASNTDRAHPFYAGLRRVGEGRGKDGFVPPPAGGYSFSYTTMGTEPEGAFLVSIQVVDLAGNRRSESLADRVTFDFTAPKVVSSVASPALAALGGEVVYQVTIDEPLAEGNAPKLVTSPSALAWTEAEVEGSSYRWRHTAASGESGTYAVAIDKLCDDLGNCAENVTAGATGNLSAVRIDANAPTLQAFQLLPAPDARVKTGVEVKLNVNVDENMGLAAGYPRARIGGKEMPLSRAPDAGWAYTFAYVTDETKGAEGAQTVVLDLADAAGNAKTETVGLVTFDFKNPAVLSARPGAPSFNSTDTVVYTINVSEPLAGNPGRPLVRVFHVGTELLGFFGAPAYETDVGFSYARPAAGIADGKYSVKIDLADLAGNTATGIDGAGFEIDATVPLLGNIGVRPLRTDESGLVSVTFECTEDVGDTPPAMDIRIGVRPADACSHSGTPPAVAYECFYNMKGNEIAPGTEATELIVINASDSAGNVASGGSNVVFDFKDPAVATATVAYVPESTNPLGQVSAAKAGTKVSVTVIADEALDTGVTPAMTATKGATTLTFNMAAGSFSPGGVTFETVVPQGAADGVYSPSVTWTDVAGNTTSSAVFSDPPITVKTSTPALEIKQGQVRYLRSPLGNAAPENLGKFTFPAGPYFALAPADPLQDTDTLPADTFSFGLDASLVEIRIWADDKKNALLGTAMPNTDGSWPRRQLANLDTAAVFVTGLDEAGNESIPREVLNAEWVATSNQPAYGDSPHELRRTHYLVPSSAQDPFTTDSPGIGAEGADGTAVLARAEAAWRERALSQAKPSARSQFGMAYDSARGTTVIFGGWDAANRQDTWEWDGTAWVEKLPQGDRPSARNMHALVYDAARGRVVLFGGYDGTADQQDLWEWNGVSWLKRSSGGGPSARVGHAMAYDSGRGAIVLFGGKASALKNDMWEWNGTNWTPLSSAGKPSARWGHALVYDSGRDVLVLFGGNDGANLQDTWEWDGNSWTQKTPAGSVPPNRTSHRMAYDEKRKKTVLFGGIDGAAILRDVWEWDGTAWVEKNMPAGDPRGAYEHGMAYDAVRERVLLFGGVTGVGLVQAMWEWDGERWIESRGDRPVPRYNHAMSYDSDRKKVVLFGGRNDIPYQDTWEWDGAGWFNRTPGGPNPSPRHDTALAYDKVRKKTVLFGGADGLNPLGETWEWDGSAWEQKSPASSPSARMGHAMAFDTERGLVVLFGGGLFPFGQDDTWEWDGTDWTQASPSSSPPARSMHAMAYDSVRKKVVMVGGYNFNLVQQLFYDDVWEWDGTEWRDVSPAQNRPQARYRHAIAFDDDRGRLVLFGGFYDNRFNDTWEWDGSAWTNKTPSKASPSVRLGHAMAYDAANKRMVVFGGAGGSDDTWEYDASEGRTPAIQFTVSAMGAGIDEGMITGIRVRAHAGGLFSPYDAQSKGAALLGWAGSGPAVFPGQWLPLASNTTGVNPANPYLPMPNAALIDWTAPTTADALRFFMVRDRAMSFQVRPSGPSGPGSNEAQAAVDYLEIRINYQVP